MFESTGFNWKGRDPNMHDNFVNQAVSTDYGKTMGWEFSQGRDFSREHPTDSLALVLNEAAVNFMGLKDPVDEEITWQGKKYHVIGVIKDMVMTSPYEPVKQTIFRVIPFQGLWINIRLNPAMSPSESIARTGKVFHELIPASPFEYKLWTKNMLRSLPLKKGSVSSQASSRCSRYSSVVLDFSGWLRSLRSSARKRLVSARSLVLPLEIFGRCFRLNS
ncbi:MAG: ABC transporter permease [Bacteroidota bacterium]